MTDHLRLTSRAIDKMTLATEPWLSCDDCFDHLDAVIDGALTQTGVMSEAFRVHLAGCSVCREEATSLAALVAPEYGVDASRAIGLLESAAAVASSRDDRSPGA
jgi:hypothetical protein